MPRMTQARTASYGVVTPPPLYRWIDAVLLLFAELVHSAASTLKMIRARFRRDWHTTEPHKALPHATSSNHALAPILRDDRRFATIPQDETGGHSTKESRCFNSDTSLEALILRDCEAIVSKDEGGLTDLSPGGVEHASPAKAGVQSPRNARTRHAQHAHLTPVIPAAARQREELEPRSHVHAPGLKPLVSGSRAPRASGMTPCVRPKSA